MDVFEHKKLAGRIKDVMENDAYKEHHDLLQELFPEIIEDLADHKFQQDHRLGNVYVRVYSDYPRNILSMLMIVRLGYEEDYEFKFLNLLTGSFWAKGVRSNHSSISLTEDEFKELIGTNNPKNFIRIGKFSHSQHSVFLLRQYDNKILFTKNLNSDV